MWTASLVALAACEEGDAAATLEEASPEEQPSSPTQEGRVTTREAARLSAGRPVEAERNRPKTADGYEIILPGPRAKVGERAGGYDAEAVARRKETLVLEPTSPDPEAGEFTLEEAVEGMPIDGELVAEIHTDLGVLLCDLHADRAPRTVANFIGLARGRRPWWDPAAGAWVKRPFYDRTEVHRVVPDFLIQFGDVVGDGTGGAGYTLEPESAPTLRHDRAGRLSMANEGDAVSGAQFFVLDGPAPQLDADDRAYSVFGQCRPESVVERIARVPQTGAPLHHPLTRVDVWFVRIRRVEGGAAEARVTRPRPLPGMDPTEQPRGASPSPSELRSRRE